MSTASRSAEPEIVRELERGRGTQWDPTLVDLVLRLIETEAVSFSAEGLYAPRRLRADVVVVIRLAADHDAEAGDAGEALRISAHLSVNGSSKAPGRKMR